MNKTIKIVIVVVVALAVASGIFEFIHSQGFSFSSSPAQADFSYGGGLPPIPGITKNPDITNILVLGDSVGRQSQDAGAMLTDSIMLVSVDSKTHKVAMTSIPRDIYLTMPLSSDKQKINEAYQLGEEKQPGLGLAYAKWEVSRVTGQYIDYAVVINLNSFQGIVDAVGGVDIYRATPFDENVQWHNDPIFAATNGNFHVPAGWSHLDGTMATYYVRSRETTTDFNRAARQQQVILAVKDKLESLGIWNSIPKLMAIYSAVKDNIETDMTVGDIYNMLTLAKNLNYSTINHTVLDVSTSGPFCQTNLSDGTYVILPKNGTFADARNIMNGIIAGLQNNAATSPATTSATGAATTTSATAAIGVTAIMPGNFVTCPATSSAANN